MTTDRYGVIGHPIAHSLSPWVHARLAERSHQSLEYGRIDAPPETFPAVVSEFFAAGGRGLNVTLPQKLGAFELADELTAAARLAGSVNTLAPTPDGRLLGENTDGIGLLRDLEKRQGCVFVGLRILLLGAGGAARGCIGPLLGQRPAQVVVANRTAQRARDLAEEFAGLGAISGDGFDEVRADRRFDLVINATSGSLDNAVPAIPPACIEGALCCDLMYAARPTAFMRWTCEHGAASAIDGLGMLIEQAAASFFLWRGVAPDTTGLCEELREVIRKGNRG